MSLLIGSAVVDWVAKRTNEYGSFTGAQGSNTAQGLGWVRNGQIVAGVVYAEWNGPNVVCHIASDGSRRWLTREFLWTIFDYPFNQLECRRITVCVGEGNSNSRRFVEHLGFELETTLRAAHPTGDLLVYSMFSESCKWISAATCKPFAKAA